MANTEFEVYRASAFYGSYSYAGNGLCSLCGNPAEWMKGRKAYCESCKTRIESNQTDKLRLSAKQLNNLRLMYEGAELYEDLSHGGPSYIEDVLKKDETRAELRKIIDRRKLERKGVIKYSRSIDTIQVYDITDKGRRAVDKRAV